MTDVPWEPAETRCSACGRPLVEKRVLGREKVGDQEVAYTEYRWAPFFATVVTRKRDIGEPLFEHDGKPFRARELAAICSRRCFDRIIAEWPHHPFTNESVLPHDPRLSARVTMVGEDLLLGHAGEFTAMPEEPTDEWRMVPP